MTPRLPSGARSTYSLATTRLSLSPRRYIALFNTCHPNWQAGQQAGVHVARRFVQGNDCLRVHERILVDWLTDFAPLPSLWQVNYVGAGCRLLEPGEQADFGGFSVAARALSLGYLWDNVRVAGGAYGGGCAFNPISGGFAFSSYRDPNLQVNSSSFGVHFSSSSYYAML